MPAYGVLMVVGFLYLLLGLVILFAWPLYLDLSGEVIPREPRDVVRAFLYLAMAGSIALVPLMNFRRGQSFVRSSVQARTRRGRFVLGGVLVLSVLLALDASLLPQGGARHLLPLPILSAMLFQLCLALAIGALALSRPRPKTSDHHQVPQDGAALV